MSDRWTDHGTVMMDLQGEDVALVLVRCNQEPVRKSLDNPVFFVTLIQPEILRPVIYNVPSEFTFHDSSFHPEATS